MSLYATLAIIFVSFTGALALWIKGFREKYDPIFRILLTIGFVGIFLPFGIWTLNGRGLAMILGMLSIVCLGMVLVGIWGSYLGGFVGDFFGGLYTGGNQRAKATPFYSIFRAKRNQGKYFEALTEIRKQLDKFPNDVEGQNLLAELQAENMNDLPGAEVTILRLCSQPNISPVQIAYALNRLADWHLDLTKDRDSGQRILEKIMELLPDTEMALRASQRLAHLADPQMLLGADGRERPKVKKGIQNLGLVRGTNGKLKVPEVDLAKQAQDYVAQLEQHPLDTHAREQLAILYANHYHRLDMAVEQLEQMIAQPSHTLRQLTHWLNVMADLQVKEGAALEQVQATLQRIIDLNDGTAAADIARRRMDSVKLELKGHVKPREMQIGVYEQNLGLKAKRS